MKVLLHTCCAPCAVSCVETLRTESLQPIIFMSNPNIHPFTEHKLRRDTLIRFCNEENLPYIDNDTDYGLEAFLERTYPIRNERDKRCAECYIMRLTSAADAAKANGFDAFTTTLLISPYQNHGLLREIGEKLAADYNLTFLYRDFRPYFKKGQETARARGFYMQKYCGCIFSESERHTKKK